MKKLANTLRNNLKSFQLTLFGFCQVFLYLLLGQLLSLTIPLPSAIIGLLICCGVCFVLKKVPFSLELASNLLLKNMPLFFIPYVVTVTLYWPNLKNYWLICLTALLISTVVTLSITSLLCDKLIEHTSKGSIN